MSMSDEFWNAHQEGGRCFGIDDICTTRSYGLLRTADPNFVAMVERSIGSDPWSKVPAGRRAVLALLASTMTPMKLEAAREVVEKWAAETEDRIRAAGLICLNRDHETELRERDKKR